VKKKAKRGTDPAKQVTSEMKNKGMKEFGNQKLQEAHLTKKQTETRKAEFTGHHAGRCGNRLGLKKKVPLFT